MCTSPFIEFKAVLSAVSRDSILLSFFFLLGVLRQQLPPPPLLFFFVLFSASLTPSVYLSCTTSHLHLHLLSSPVLVYLTEVCIAFGGLFFFIPHFIKRERKKELEEEKVKHPSERCFLLFFFLDFFKLVFAHV